MDKTKYPNDIDRFEDAYEAFMNRHSKHHELVFNALLNQAFMAGWIAAGGVDPR